MLSGFILPNNQKIAVPYEQMGDFCREFCLNYMNQSEENMEKFRDFCKPYEEHRCFFPYYDFLIHNLGFVQVGFLNDSKKVAFSNKNKLTVKYYKELDYDKIMELKDLEFAGYEEIHEFRKPSFFITKEGFYMRNDILFTLRKDEYHEEMAPDLIQQLCFTFPSIMNDFLENNIFQLKKDYLVHRLGICKIQKEKGSLIFMYDGKLASEYLKLIVEMSRKKNRNSIVYTNSMYMNDDERLDEIRILIDSYTKKVGDQHENRRL